MMVKKIKRRKKYKSFLDDFPNFNFVEELKLCFSYLKESRYYILFTILAFFGLGILGFLFFYFASPDVLEVALKSLEEWVKALNERTAGFGFLEMWWFIFENNSMIAFVSIFLGFFLGIVPSLFLFSNGLFIGFVSGFAFSLEGFSVLLQLLPHGIFEIPAIIISFALGIRAGGFIFYKDRKKRFVNYLKNSIRTFLFVVLPLLIIASLIESALIVFF